MNYIVPELYNKAAAQQPEAKKPGWLSAVVGPVLLGLGAVANKNLSPAKAMFGPMLAQRARKFGVGLKVTRPIRAIR